MEVKVTWDEIEVKENIDKTLAKILMLKGEKGDTGTTDYNELLNKPTKLSDFINDGVFITNTVNDLANYYLKSDTYTQTEINNLVSAIPKFAIAVAEQLPTEDISPTTIYLVPSDSESGDLYKEYIYVNNAWELLGIQKADLTNYYNKSETDTLLNAKVNINDLASVATSGSYNDLENKPTSLTDFGGVLPIDQGGTGATNVKDAITNLGGVPIYTGVTSFISLPATTAEIIQAMPYPSILMTWVDTVSNSITDLPCSYGTLTIHKRSGTRLQILYNRSYEGAVNGNNFYFGNYNTLSKTVTWNKIFTSYSGCQVPIENGGTGASNVSVARTNLDVYSKSEILDVIYPVGAIYMSVNSASPQTLFGGSWEQIQDRFLLASGSTYSAGSTGGAATHYHTTADHTLTINEIPSHTHGYRDANDDSSTDIWCYINSNRKGSINYVEPTGGGQPHNHGNTDEASNLPPYLSVYIWKRIA